MSKYIIEPFSKIIGVIFIWLVKNVGNLGLSLIALSIIINVILFPFYHIAEKIERKEKEIQEKMRPKIEEFESVYKGYELHLYISNVYRLNNYHPIYALRGLVSLLIQIPFFMGAYAFLSNYSGFEGVSFLFISDLSKSDGLLKLGSYSINILPFVMTAINLLSGYFYTKGSPFKEKLTIIIMAVFFLVLLYNSPSSLLIYWTFNNVFGLIKTITYKVIENNKLEKEVLV